jgi:type IV pilus assembly protein PilY1
MTPKERLAFIDSVYSDCASPKGQYGLAGNRVTRTVERKTLVYLGMHRGGNNYYAFDLSSKINPKLVFTINGKEGEFTNLGQTWSRPVLTKISIGKTVKNVMIIGGGYDPSQDNKLIRSEDSIGNSVFIIDADSGQLLWSASNANADLVLDDMKYSIVARVSAVDRNRDGLADHLYIADLGGQLFRLDIYNGASRKKLVKGGLLGTFSGDTAANNRRFYYAPDVSEMLVGERQYYAIAIGSGFSANPVDTKIDDEFYLIEDTGVFNTNNAGEFLLPTVALTQNDLYDATSHLLTTNDANKRDHALQNLSDKSGWRLSLRDAGEKVLASPSIVDAKVFFTSYLPASTSNSPCAADDGKSRAYLVSVLNGNAVVDLNRNNEREPQDRYAELTSPGIAPFPKILIENMIEPSVCFGALCADATIEFDEYGVAVDCGSDFKCLAQNIYGRFERIKKYTWKTEIEKP